jgi:intracellular septation protein A
MDWSFLLLDLLPLAVFALLDALGNLRYALIGAVAASAFELLYSHFFLGGIDAISLVFAGLILAFAALSYAAKNPLFFKLKPAVIGFCTGLILLATSAIGRPAMLEMTTHYAPALPASMQSQLAQASARALLARANLFLGVGLLGYAAACAWAARHLNRWWWLAISGPGLYIVALLSALLATVLAY